MLDFWGWLILIGIVLVASTAVIKKYVKGAKSWAIITMLRFEKPRRIFDAFRQHPKWVDRLTDLGLVIGFGAIAVDYLWMQKKPMWHRLLVFLVVTAALGMLIPLLFPLDNPIVPIPPPVIQVGFGIFGLSGLILVSLFYSGVDILNKMLLGKNACAGVAPVIPGVDLPNSPISVPLHAWLSFVIILIVHEASHGFVIRKLGMKIKSYGLLLLGFLPIGAFVEPDENELKKLEKNHPREALRMYAAGPASNFYFFVIGTLLVFLFTFGIAGPILGPTLTQIHGNAVSGVIVQEVQDSIVICGTEFEAPAHNVLLPGDKIIAVDGQPIQVLRDYVLAVQGKTAYTLTIDRDGAIMDHSFNANELGRIGITVREVANPDYTPPSWYEPFLQVAGFVASFVGWLLLLNFLVATANFIPILPFDGGKMAVLLLAPYLGFLKMDDASTKKAIQKVFLWIMLALIIV
ncbi:MAG: M50 family metallopeptidase, partial [archaeon]|nr:M50 family metallopeptidase [archaeon]